MNQESKKAGNTRDANDPELDAALTRGIADVQARRVHSVEEVRSMIPEWIANPQRELRA